MQTVISAFDDRELAQRAVDRLVERGFGRDAIHIEPGREATGDAAGDANRDHAGFFHAIGRFFADLFGSDQPAGDSGRYAEAVRRGGSIVIVDARDADAAERARALLEEVGGHIDLEERAGRWRDQGWTGFDAAAPRTPPDPAAAAERAPMPSGARAAPPRDASVVPVLEEQVQVGKRQVTQGGVRVVSHLRSTPVRELVRLREERAVVERRPVDRPATQADLEAFREGTLEVRETVEEPVVSKTARVVEEVVVGKRVEERTQAVDGLVRRSAVEVEPLGLGASERMLERTGGRPTTPHGDAPATPRDEAKAEQAPIDPEVQERTR